MQSPPKQSLPYPVSALASLTLQTARVKSRRKQDAGKGHKQGTEMKCGCGPWNGLPVLQVHPRTSR